MGHHLRVVDSRAQTLPLTDVLLVVAENIGLGGDPDTVLSAGVDVINEADDMFQIGNTLFIYNLVNGRANGQVFNADTGPNFIRNCVTYFHWLQHKQVKQFEATADQSISRCLRIFARLLKGSDSTLETFELPDKSLMKLNIGQQPIRKCRA